MLGLQGDEVVGVQEFGHAAHQFLYPWFTEVLQFEIQGVIRHR